VRIYQHLYIYEGEKHRQRKEKGQRHWESRLGRIRRQSHNQAQSEEKGKRNEDHRRREKKVSAPGFSSGFLLKWWGGGKEVSINNISDAHRHKEIRGSLASENEAGIYEKEHLGKVLTQDATVSRKRGESLQRKGQGHLRKQHQKGRRKIKTTTLV